MTIFEGEEYNITSVSKLLQLVEKKFYTSSSKPNKWMYRGESNFSNKLIPSIGRLINKEPFNSNVEELEKFEKQAFNQFKINTYNQLREKDDYIILSVAQHHGLKTRLLDWSWNLLVALYFSVEDENKYDVDGSFIAFRFDESYRFNDMPSGLSPLELTIEVSDYYFIYSPSLSPRIKAQQGVFQLFTSPTKPFEEGYDLQKIKIPVGCKREIKRELYEMGVHAEYLFPDMDGLSKSINYFSLGVGK